MRGLCKKEENAARRQVEADASRLISEISLKAYIEGWIDGRGGPFGIQKAVIEYMERADGHGRMAILSEMVAIREKRVSTIPPKHFVETEPLAEDILK